MSRLEFAKKLLSLARHGDQELLNTFEASFENKSFNEDSIDDKFFIENAKEIVDEHVAPISA
jgi:hypothetical protein